VNSQVMESLGLKKRFVTSEDLAAIKNRFLEAYIHKKPFQDETHIKLNETYDRFHFIVGTFERAISTLEKYNPSDFHSSFLYRYVIGALRKNSLYYEEVMKGNIDGEETAENGGAHRGPAAAVAETKTKRATASGRRISTTLCANCLIGHQIQHPLIL